MPGLYPTDSGCATGVSASICFGVPWMNAGAIGSARGVATGSSAPAGVEGSTTLPQARIAAVSEAVNLFMTGAKYALRPTA